MTRPTAVVIGVGAEQGLGAALCRRFAREGHHVFVAGRTTGKISAVAKNIVAQGGAATPVVTDATSEADVISLFDQAMSGAENTSLADLVVYNAADFVMSDFRKTTAADFEAAWRVGCFGGFLVGREAARRFVPLGRGTILFTGASASLRGRPNFAHFSAAKAGLRMVTQSMAREYGPLGVHVAHVIVDGSIKGHRVLSRMPDLLRTRGEDGLLNTEALAETYWQLHKQHRSAWTQETEVRPFNESF